MEAPEAQPQQLLVATNKKFQIFHNIRLILCAIASSISTYFLILFFLVPTNSVAIAHMISLKQFFNFIFLWGGTLAALIPCIIAFTVKLPNYNLKNKNRFNNALIGAVALSFLVMLSLYLQTNILIAHLKINNHSISFLSISLFVFISFIFACAIAVFILSIQMNSSLKTEYFAADKLPPVIYN